LKNGKEQARKIIGLNPESFCFLLPASGDFLKRDVNRFIDIFLKIYNENKNCQAIITGKDSSFKKYLSKISDIGLSNIIKIIEPIKDVNIIYESADCIIYPAVLEEFGIAIMEGMVSKIPVLCTMDIGVTELMKEEVKNFSLCLSDYDFVSKALMLINKQVSKDMFNDNAIHISHMTWEKTSDDIYKVYNDTLKIKHSERINPY
jgi:glycosyltransferase involved in cell wall biosynthesis